MLQIQNVWDTLSLGKQFLEAELNVRESLGIQGIIHPTPHMTKVLSNSLGPVEQHIDGQTIFLPR